MKIDLSKHPRLELVIKYAKKNNCLKFSPQSVEVQLPEPENHLPYREGFYAEDITGFWNPETVIDYLKGNLSGYKDGLEFGKFKAFSFLSLALPWSGWVWVLNSFESYRHELVLDKIGKERSSKKKKELYDKYDQLVSEVTEDEVLDYVKSEFMEIKPHLFVSKEDPSVIVYDQKHKPYLLKHGWSKEQVGEILTEWLEEVADVKVPYKFIENAKW